MRGIKLYSMVYLAENGRSSWLSVLGSDIDWANSFDLLY